MLKTLSCILLSVALLPGCASTVTHNSANVQLTAGGRVDSSTFKLRSQQVTGVLANLDKIGRSLVKEGTAPGLAAALILDGKVLWRGGWGVSNLENSTPVSSDTVFRIASITKTLTGLAILKLRDDGALSLDDELVKTVPEIAHVIAPTTDASPIRLRHLLTHTSGLPKVGSIDYWSRSDKDLSEGEILQSLKGLKLLTAPGAQVSYSNLGAALLGIVIKRLSGVSYEDYVTSKLLLPLKMTHSVWSEAAARKQAMAVGYARGDNQQWQRSAHWRLGAGAAMGGLYSSLSDMTRYLVFQLNAWPPRNARDPAPVKRSSVRESHLVLGFGHPGLEQYGAAWGVGATPNEGDLVIAHSGSTHLYSAAVRLLPERGIGVVVLANASNSRALMGVARKMISTVIRVLAGGGLSVPLIRP